MFVPILASAAAVAPPPAQAAEVAPAPAPVSDAAAAGPAAPPRGELLVGIGVAGGSSGWSGDPVGYGDLKLGLRLFRVITPFVQGRLGYGRIDQRMLTFLSAGLEGGAYIQDRYFPRGFVAFVHQHEESMASVDEEPFGALLGVGPGIRHRVGAQFGLGFDFVVHRAARYDIKVGPEAIASYLTYSSGPNWYVMVGAAGSAHFNLF